MQTNAKFFYKRLSTPDAVPSQDRFDIFHGP